MKTLTLFFLFLFFLFTATISARHHSIPNLIRLPTSGSLRDSQPIRDVDGNEIRVGQRYYMTSVIWGAGGGGVRLARLDKSDKCPRDVIQARNDLDLGDPIEFMPEDESNDIVDASSFHLVSFNVRSNDQACQNRQAWTVELDRESERYFVRTGEMENALKIFKIEVVDQNLNAYKLTYCPVKDQCYNVGRFRDEETNTMRLALSETPFVVIFRKLNQL